MSDQENEFGLDDMDAGSEEEVSEDTGSEEVAPEEEKPKKGKKKKASSEEEVEVTPEPAKEAVSGKDYLNAPSFGDLVIKKIPGMRSGKAGPMLRAFSESPLTQTVLPFDPLNPNIKEIEFQMQGVRFSLPVGEPVMVPSVVSEFIRQTVYAAKR